MANSEGKQGVETADGDVSANADARLKWTVLGIIVVLAVALGLKTWDERQRDDFSQLALLFADTSAIAGRMEGRADTAETAIKLIHSSPSGRSDITSATPGVDVVVSVNDASQSPAGSRLAEAAATAAKMIERGDRTGLSTAGDVVLVTQISGGAPMMAIAPAGSWLPPQRNGSRLTVMTADGVAGFGDASLATAATKIKPLKPGMTSLGGLQRAASACAPIDGRSMFVCRTVAKPLFSINDLLRLLVFALLLAAPVLAIVGLMRRLSAEETAVIVEEVRDDEADRIMGVVMRGAQAGYWELEQGTGSLFLSEAGAALFGMTGSGPMGQDVLLTQIHPKHRDRVQQVWEKGRELGWIQTSFMTNGTPARWIEMRGAVSDNEGSSQTSFGGIVLDVTQRKQADDRVRAAERRLRAAIEGFNGPFALWDNRKRLLYWNRAFALDFGLQDTLRAGMGHDTVVIARAGAVRSEKQSAEDSRSKLIELQTNRWLKMVERSTPDGGLITVGVDVTENVRNEEELKQQRHRMKKALLDLERSEGRASELSRKYSEEKTKAERAAHTKSAFLANMSHELRTPLNAINGFSEILANELYGPLGDNRYKGYSQDILTSGQHLLDMINDILDMAKIEAGKMTINPQPIDPVDPVDAAVRMIRRKAEDKQIEMVLDAQPGLPEIDADHRAIRQMVLNLVSNAIKFTDGGGRITVSVEQRGPDVFVGVTDTGIGIPAEDLPRLAMPFEQVSGTRDRNYEGTGLGLALTKSFAEMHGGRMSIQSIEGEGTTVAFTLPIAGPDMEDADGELISRDVA